MASTTNGNMASEKDATTTDLAQYVDEYEEEGTLQGLKYFNRELSWLHFNARVLRQAADESIPLLERVRFLSIFESNLDEFFMKRVGGLKRHIAAGILQSSIDGLSPKQQLHSIRQVLIPQVRRADTIYNQDLRPRLFEEGVQLLDWKDLASAEKKYCKAYFEDHVFPLLTPLAVDAGHPFPFLSNLSSSLGVAVAHPDREEPLFARVKTSGIEPQWLPVSDVRSGDTVRRFVPLWQVICESVDRLFPDMQILGKMMFRITRNIELEVDEEDAEDLRELMEEELRQRRRGLVCRLEHGPDPDEWILNFLKEELQLHPHDIYELAGEYDYRNLSTVTSLDLPHLKFPTWTPTTPLSFREETSIFNVLKNHDVLVHHPFESFASSVERFVRESVEDPKVKSIKMTVYRVGDETPIIPLLVKAAERGKHVVCLVELKARFDEERNLEWSQQLEEAGVHVVYGIAGLKIHAKTLLVVRQESDKVRCYAHIATGNYHSLTANHYTDLALFTSKEKYTRELLDFFNYLTGRSLKQSYETLLVAPFAMEQRFLEYVQAEIDNKKQGKEAQIILKMNSLEDKEMIDALYAASSAGVDVQLYVRGICCLRPGVRGMSENIKVISIIGRLLEHSRVFYFRSASEDPVDGEFFISSADWMYRNLHRRIEVAVPIEERSHRERIWGLFQVLKNDEALAWELNADGSYSRRSFHADRELTGTHEVLMRRAKELSLQANPTN